MTSFTLKGLPRPRKLRTALTAIAIILGVATVSGTFVLTDSIDKAFNSIFTEVYSGTDATITAKSPVRHGGRIGDDRGRLRRVAAARRCRRCRTSRTRSAASRARTRSSSRTGRRSRRRRAEPRLLASTRRSRSSTRSRSSRAAGRARTRSWSTSRPRTRRTSVLGSTIGVQAEGPVESCKISGFVKFGSVGSIGGATLRGFDLPTAQRLFGKEGKLDQIRVALRSRASHPSALVSRDPRDPAAEHARSAPGRRRRSEDATATDEFISFLRYFLLAFGLIALFVGAFVIVNSLSITIAQRTRELATLRTLGASRRQVQVSVVLEALVMGVLASVVGLFLGLGLAKGLFSLFDAVGFTLPNNGILLEARTVVVSLALGILVTLIASFFPALRATRVPPIAAVREGAELPPGRFHRFRTPFAALLDRARLRAARARALLARHLDRAAPADPRHAARVHRRRDALGAVHPRALRPPRVAGDEDRRRGRHARARQRAAQPAAHRVHCRRADDRPRARHARGDARGGHHRVVQRRRERHLHGGLRDHGAEQLLADPDLGRRGSGRRRRVSSAAGSVRTGEHARVRQEGVHDRGDARGAGRDDARTGRRARRT